MTSLSIILLAVCILEAILIIWLNHKRSRTQIAEIKVDTMPISEIINAFQNNGYEVKQLSLGSLEEHLRTFKLRIQNEGYEKAELRVIEKMDVFLTELWRLKYIERDKIAARLLLLLDNTVSISLSEDASIRKSKNSLKQYDLHGTESRKKTYEVGSPAISYKGVLIKRGIVL